MPRDVENVIDPSDDPEITVLVLTATVAGEIAVFAFAPVNLFVALGIAPQPAQHRRPRFAHDKLATGIFWHCFPFVIHHFGHDTEKRQRGRTGLGRNRARQWRDHDSTGFRLPPGVDDRTTFGSDVFVIPDPRFGIDRFAD